MRAMILTRFIPNIVNDLRQTGGCDLEITELQEAFIRTIPLMMYHKHRPEDLNTELEDHAADEWRYLCMSCPVAPLRPVAEKPLLIDPLKRSLER